MGMFSSKKITIGYKYFLGLQQIFCAGPVDKVLRIDVDDKPIWAGSMQDGVANIDSPQIFGGKKKGGGVAGRVDIQSGKKNQGQNGYLKSKLGVDVPAFRGVLQLVFNKFYVGNSTVLKPFSVVAQRTDIRADGSEQWYQERVCIYGGVLPFVGGASFVLRWLAGQLSSQTDAARMGIKAYDSNNNEVYSNFSDYETGGWARQSLAITLPSDAVKFRIYMQMQRYIGTDNNGYITDIYCTISQVLNRMALNGTNHWINEQGGISTRTEYGWQVFDGGTSAFTSAYQEITEFARWDMNPAHIIREAITEPWGLAAPEQDVEDLRPVADALFNEKFGLSFEYTQQGSVSEFIQEVAKHINAAVFVDRFTGKYNIKLIRGDYDESTLPVFNNRNVLSIKNFKKPALGELTNSVTVNYWDASIESMGSVTVQHNALLEKMNGEVNNTTITYNGVTNRPLALRLCDRDLGSLSKSLISCQLELTREAHKLQVGDVFRLQLAEYGGIDAIMRITKMKLGDSKNRSIIVDVTEDAFALADNAVYDVVESEFEQIAKPPTDAKDLTVREISLHEFYRENGEITGKQLLTDVPDYGQLVAASAQPEGALQAILMLDKGQTGQYVEGETLDFCPALTLTEVFKQGDTLAYVESVAEASTLQLPYLAQIGNELVRVDALDDVNNTATLSRGACDTVPFEHSAGKRLLFVRDFLAVDDSDYINGDVVDAKLLTLSSLGQTELADAALQTVTFAQRLLRPYPPGNVQLNGQYFPEQLNADVNLTWAHRDRTTENGSDIADFTAGDVGPEAGTNYDVIIKDENDAELISSLGQTGTNFAYVNADERTAFNTKVNAPTGVYEVLGEVGVGDPYFNSVVSLMHFDGINAQTTITDQISSNSWIIEDGAKLAVADKKFGSTSLKFYGNTNDRARLTSSAVDFNIANKDFTIEFFANILSFTGVVFFCAYGSSTSNSRVYRVQLDADKKISFLTFNGASSPLQIFTGATMPMNQWSHIAVTSVGGIVRVFVDGIPNTPTAITTQPMTGTTSKFSIGNWDAGGFAMDGLIDEFRFTSGVARYTEQFTPPTKAYPNKYGLPEGELVLPKRLSNPLSIELSSKRDGLTSYQSHKLSPARYGYSYKYKDLYKAR